MAVQAPSKPVSKACSSVTAKTVAGALQEIEQIAKGGADIVELRLDFMIDFNAEKDIPALLGASSIPAIVTYRPVWEGGLYDGDEQARLKALLHAAKSGAAYIDVELKAAESFSKLASPSSLGPTTLILSSHNFQIMPPLAELKDIHARAVAAGAGIVKIAAMAKTITDVDVMSQLMRDEGSKKTTIALAMGEAGQARPQLPPQASSCAAWPPQTPPPHRSNESLTAPLPADMLTPGVAPPRAQDGQLPHLRRPRRREGVRPGAASARGP